MTDLENILNKYWGYTNFRPLQREIIGSVLEKKDTMALLPTGGGKSICYQIPAMMNDGCCLVISPLIALMQDQVQRLKEKGIPAVAIHAGMHYNDVKRHLENAVEGAYKLLYLSPERLQNAVFQEYLPDIRINLFAIDEAHCISQWGHDFRPDYLKIASLRRIFSDTPFLALTASATATVQDDIVAQLQLKNPDVFRQSFKKETLYYNVTRSDNKIRDTADILREQPDAAIVYCRSRKQTELLTNSLNGQGVEALYYHAGMLRDKREETQKKWTNSRRITMVATTAFGMGIDKADVRNVVHYDTPEYLEAYYQEAGRAGRDNRPAKTSLLWNDSDIRQLKNSASLKFPDELFLRSVYQAVCEYLQLAIGTEPEMHFDIEVTDLCRNFNLPVVPTYSALKLLEQEGLWTLSDAVFKQATVVFTVERDILDGIINAYPDLGMVCITLLRLYNAIFHYPASVRLQDIARQTKLDIRQVDIALEQLHKFNVLTYKKASDKPQLFFHHYRVDSRHLIIDLKRIQNLRALHQERTDSMIAFLLNDAVCREKMLLKYFGEDAPDHCGHCDICKRNADNNIDLGTIRRRILELLTDTESDSHTLLKNFSLHLKPDVLDQIRILLDEEKITRTTNGFRAV